MAASVSRTWDNRSVYDRYRIAQGEGEFGSIEIEMYIETGEPGGFRERGRGRMHTRARAHRLLSEMGESDRQQD